MTGELRTIVVPTDFSDGAHVALERAKRLPLVPGGRLLLLHVVPTSLHDAILRESAAAGARHQLSALADAVGRDARIETEVAIGEPFEVIGRRSRELAADLIVVGRHGQRAVRDVLIGTTAERAIRHSASPMLVVSRPATRPYERPLVTTDLEDSVTQVARAMRALVKPADAIPVLHASQDERSENGARDRVAVLISRLTAESGASWFPLIRIGDPRDVIIDELVARDVDLVAVGTHGRAGLSRVLLGSVAERVIHAARCDVLVVRT